MAKKMFYTLTEAAEQLGVDEQSVKDLAGEGKLQQFRDRDQLMFKCDEVDSLAGGGAGAAGGGEAGGGDAREDSGELSLATDTPEASEPAPSPTTDASASPDDSGTIPLAEDSAAGTGPAPVEGGGSTPAGGIGAPDDSGAGTGTIDLTEDESATGSPGEEDPNQGTGVSVFDADEVESADPMAQTQVNRPAMGEEELALENVGSGSGLLDLTRESDDTSLGAAELLDEIYPGGEQQGGGEADTGGSSVGSSGMDSAMETGLETGTGGSAMGSSGVLEATQTGTAEGAELETMGAGATQIEFEQPGEAFTEPAAAAAHAYAEPDDPTGSGFGAGMLIGVTLTLVVGMLVSLGALLNVRITVIEQMSESQNALLLWCGGLLAVSIVCGIIGLLIGKAVAGATTAAQPVAGAAE